MYISNTHHAACFMLAVTLLVGCGPTSKEWEPDKKEPMVFDVAFRQLPPEPVYNRQRWVHLPEPLPSKELPDSSAPLIQPVFHMDLKNVTLEEAAKSLALTSRYTSYCASTIASQKISINSLGTTSELAEQISRKANVHVVVDDVNKEIRFMAGAAQPGKGDEPRFVKED